MDTAPLKSFAMSARVDLIREVGARLDVVLARDSSLRLEQPRPVGLLESAVRKEGREQVIDRVAYSWFNRIVALRFMDANGYTGVGVVSPELGKTGGQPQLLSDAKGGEFDSSVLSEEQAAAVTALLNGTRPSNDPQGEAYGLLLASYCQHWNKFMPFMFDEAGDYTELLMPSALLAGDSVRDRAVKTLTEEACREVEVIGWLYQFYISERKDEVFAGFKKNKKAGAAEIPAATQLFTPHWIVRYLVENSVGRLWLLNHPQSRIAEKMDYYIKPVDEETEFLTVNTPQELTVIDPAVGSGHMLTYAFDLLYAIYEEEGYSPSEIPSNILQHNLYGIEIDPRAGALAAFALTMKAAAKRKLFLKDPTQPNICVLENIHFDESELDYLWSLTDGRSVTRPDADEFWNVFEHADITGALIRPNSASLNPLGDSVVSAGSAELLGFEAVRKASKVIVQATYLTGQYSTVVANPPYMGTTNMSGPLRKFAELNYPNASGDLCTMFIERSLELTTRLGYSSLVASESWIFTASFAAMRRDVLSSAHPQYVACIDKSAFRVVLNTVATVIRLGGIERNRSRFFRVSADDIASGKIATLPPVDSKVWDVHVSNFSKLPGAPFAFDYPEALLTLADATPSVGKRFEAKQGLATADNGRFVRYWWEVSRSRTEREARNKGEALSSRRKWFPYNKGGTPVAWWGSQDLVVNWGNDGEEIRSFGTDGGGRRRSAVRNPDYYFRPAVTWSNIGASGARFRLMPPGFVFDVGGMSVFAGSDEDLRNLAGLLNSRLLRRGLNVLAPTLNYQIGDVSRLPAVTGDGDAERVSELVRLVREEWLDEETAHAFGQNPLLNSESPALSSSATDARGRSNARNMQIAKLEEESEAYWAQQIEDQSGLTAPRKPALEAIAAPKDGASDADLVKDFLSVAVGCMLGRYSLDKPGLILADQGGSLEEYLEKIPNPSFVPDIDGVIPIIDGDWFEDDIVAKFRQFLRVSFGEEHFEENLKFISSTLGVRDLGDYFAKSFYKDHVQRYKKRPIYWLFSSPKGSFSALVYLHRYNSATVSTVLNEYLREFIEKLKASLEHQERLVAGIGSAKEIAVSQREADRLRKMLIGLTEYERNLYELALKKIDLDLDDGVLVNYRKFGSALRDIGLKKSDPSE